MLRVCRTLAFVLLFASSSLHARDWSLVTNWVYQLTNYQDNTLNEIARAGFNLAVIDLARDGAANFFTHAEVAAVQSNGTFVLAYFEIGALEEYRPEWKTTPDELKLAKVKGWPKERLVRFWDERWWPIVQGRVDQALKAGFDGAYLDMVTAYEEIPAKEFKREELASKMVDLISRISHYAKAKDPQFKIVPQNAPELYTWSNWEPRPNEKYIRAIDGLGLEDVFYLAHDKPATMNWCQENRQNAVAIKRAGKLILGIDYAKTPACIRDAYAKQRRLGFIPYVTVVSLDRVLRE